MNEIKELCNKLNEKNKKVILYGFGTVGRFLSLHLDSLIGIVDQGINDEDVNKLSLEELSTIDFDLIVITILDEYNQKVIVEKLNQNKVSFEKIFILNESIDIDRNKLLFAEHDRLKGQLDNNELVFNKDGLSIQIQTISHCNAKCYFCPYHGSWHQQNPGRMDDDVFKKIIYSLKSYKITKFCPYLENEPFLDQSLFQKVFFAIDELDIEHIEIATNLSVLTEKNLEDLKRLSKYNHEIRISFHGVDKETYEKVMDLNYEKALKNVKTLVTLMQEIPLNLSIRGSGKPRSSKNSLTSWFGQKEYLEFWDNELKEFDKKPYVDFFTYHDRAGQKQLKSKGATFDIYREDLDNFYCQRFDQWVHFLYTGEPVLCCMDYNRETVLGDSIKNKSFNELFSSPKFTRMLKCASGLKESPDDFICKRCISPGG